MKILYFDVEYKESGLQWRRVTVKEMWSTLVWSDRELNVEYIRVEHMCSNSTVEET